MCLISYLGGTNGFPGKRHRGGWCCASHFWRLAQAVLAAIAQVEADGYAALKGLGASPLTDVATAGGGAANGAWTEMRQRKLGVPTRAAANAEAAFGLAILATWND